MTIRNKLVISATITLVCVGILAALLFRCLALGSYYVQRAEYANRQFDTLYGLQEAFHTQAREAIALLQGEGDLATFEHANSSTQTLVAKLERVTSQEGQFLTIQDLDDDDEDKDVDEREAEHNRAAQLYYLTGEIVAVTRAAQDTTAEGDNRQQIIAQAKAAITDVDAQAHKIIDRSRFDESQEVRTAGQTLAKGFAWIQIVAVVFALLCAMVLVAMVIRFTRSLNHSLGHLLAGTERAKQGIWDLPIHLPSRDEHGRLAEAFNEMMAERQRVGQRIGKLNRDLMNSSRLAGMAEIAAGVLHNAGNVLNSINVSADLSVEALQKSRLPQLRRTLALIESHADDLGHFLTADSRGVKVLPYLGRIVSRMEDEHALIKDELIVLKRYVMHLKTVISKQQDYAKTVGLVEPCRLTDLVDDALMLTRMSMEQDGIEVVRRYAEVPEVMLDRHKVLQILTNLLSNARHALHASNHSQDKKLVLTVDTAPDGHVCVRVQDNGIGIDAEHVPKIFTYGFTTKEQGHGFGLHNSFLVAQQLGGSLHCESPGLHRGAEFRLELPLEQPC